MPEDLMGFARDVLVVGYMLVLRVGVPILITLMIGAWLKHFLEEREAKDQPEPTPSRLETEPHCWEVKQCPETEQARCVARQRPDLPCWLALQVNGAGLKSSCYACPLYTQHAPAPIKA